MPKPMMRQVQMNLYFWISRHPAEERDTVVDMVRQVAANVFIPFTVGGGIRTVEDFRKLLREGADKISVNSAAIDRPELIQEAAEKFGSQCVVVAIDAKRETGWRAGISIRHGGRLDIRHRCH